VLLVDMYEDRANETLHLVKEAGGEAAVVAADVTDATACQRVVDEAVHQFGGLDILVNNAAISPLVGILDTSPELFDQVIAVNVRGPFMLSKAAIPVMMQRGGGSIVNITSIAGIRGTGVAQTAYSTSKAALAGMTVDIANAYGRQGIRVNCVAPGHIDTPMRDAVAAEIGLDPSTLDMGARTSLGREGDAWDIARAALYLASDDARYVTGVHLSVDGGTSTRSP
jgi:NAD(P)-dependent dehydrogenase (short-subunit alcohol dehydrogenase family)